MGLNTASKAKLYAYFRKQMGMYEYKRGWLKGDCPDCGKSDKFGVSIAYNRTNCFVCGYHETPIKVIADREGFDNYAEAWDYLGIFEGYNYVEKVVEKVKASNATLPDGFKLLSIGNSLIAKAARAYMEGRGFDPMKLSLRGFGYCSSGDYQGYIIMPFYVGSKLIYFNARSFLPSSVKYKNPSLEDFGIGKSLLIFNSQALYIHRRVYLLEGLINAITMGDKGVATGGKKVSRYQISAIVKSPVEEVVVMLDPDALDQSYELALELVQYKKIKIVVLPEGEDVNKLGFRQSLRYCAKSKFLNYNEILTHRNLYNEWKMYPEGSFNPYN